jgi:hypothetical protein
VFTVTCQKNLGIRHKTASINDGLPEISKMKYRNRIPEPGTTISGFADNLKKKSNPDRPTLDFLLLVKQQKCISKFCVKIHRVASKN